MLHIEQRVVLQRGSATMLRGGNKRYFAPLLLILLSSGGCLPRRKKLEIAQAQTHKRIEARAGRSSRDSSQGFVMQEQAIGLSKDLALSMALQKNRSLQATFAQLGIAQADLEKAGLYTNPAIDAIFALPQFVGDNSVPPEITIYFSIFHIADLWLVPVKKRIAAADLELASWEITNQALTTIRDTALAYHSCVHARQQAARLGEVVHELEQKQRPVPHELALDHMRKRSQVTLAYAKLERLIDGASLADIVFTDSLQEVPEKHVPLASDDIEKYILAHPSYLIASLRLKRAEEECSLEKRRRFDDLMIGFDYQANFDRTFGFGPWVHAPLPIFDDNHARVNKARSVIEQREHELEAMRRILRERISYTFEQLRALHEQIQFIRGELIPKLIAQHMQLEQELKQTPDDQKAQGLMKLVEEKRRMEQMLRELSYSYADAHAECAFACGISEKRLDEFSL